MKKILTLTVATCLCLPAIAQVHLEAEGLVVMEVESMDSGQRFDLATSVPDYKGTGYFRGNIDSFNTGGVGKVRYPFRVTLAGTYQFAFRSRIGAGTSSTDFNDSFIRLVDAAGSPVTPVPNQNVTTSGSWYKVYMNLNGSWSHQASNKDNDPHSLSWFLEAGQEYAIELAVRSKDHLVDRLILWNQSLYNLANKTTGKNPNESAFNALEVSAIEEPAPTWAGFELDSSGNADTGNFLGWLNVAGDPWIWLYSLAFYIYLPEGHVSAAGAWAYFPAN